jgi:hypothetical protein
MSSRFFHPYSSNGLYFEQLGQSHSGIPSRSPSGSGNATGIFDPPFSRVQFHGIASAWLQGREPEAHDATAGEILDGSKPPQLMKIMLFHALIVFVAQGESRRVHANPSTVIRYGPEDHPIFLKPFSVRRKEMSRRPASILRIPYSGAIFTMPQK